MERFILILKCLALSYIISALHITKLKRLLLTWQLMTDAFECCTKSSALCIIFWPVCCAAHELEIYVQSATGNYRR